jgi:tRNA1Val (adenine37-N6)-methyltransferase
MKPFHFKQFSIKQDACAMKVSLDACLLGALCQVDNAKRILDIGSGTGLLALMAAQRCDAHIDAVELDDAAAKQAQENINDSPFLSQVSVHQQDIKRYDATSRYDVILCNPPFFSQHLKGPDAQRNQARHNDGLSFDDLNGCLSQHLHTNGTAWVLLPCSELERFEESAHAANLLIDQQWLIASRPQKSPHRTVMALKHKEHVNRALSVHTLHVHHESGPHYTDEFKALLCDYYLKL